MKWPQNVLMVNPTGFDVKYAINPHMLDAAGNLNQVDIDKALTQWGKLKETFESLGLKVFTINGETSLPDMVFTANQTFPFYTESTSDIKKTQIVLSKMNSSQRAPEVQRFDSWAHNNNIETYELKSPQTFEGMGDALWNYEAEEVYGGHGFRTSIGVYDELETIIKKPVHRLKLISEDFYHLDTCLAIVNKDTAFAVKEGFDHQSFEKLKTNFKNLIEIPLDEAKNGFAANLCCVNGTDIIIQAGNSYTCEKARELGLKVHEIDTSEFMKSGGSVFCMKQLFW